MIVSRDQLIVGRSAVQVRGLFRSVRGYAFTVLGVAEQAHLSEEEARAVIDDLTEAGLVEQVGQPMPAIVGDAETTLRYDELATFTTTIAGNALAKARIGKRMPREEALEFLEGVVRRAKDVNHDDRWVPDNHGCVRYDTTLWSEDDLDDLIYVQAELSGAVLDLYDRHGGYRLERRAAFLRERLRLCGPIRQSGAAGSAELAGLGRDLQLIGRFR